MPEVVFYVGQMTLDAIEKEAILATYEFCKQNKSATARTLGCSIRTLDYKFERYEKEKGQAQEKYAAEQWEREFQMERARGDQSPRYEEIQAEMLRREELKNGAIKIEDPVPEAAPVLEVTSLRSKKG